ncbi:hypothetical protein L917_02563, partial [Phytophthora nicotianae]
MYILRSLDQGKPLPELNAMFFYRCCAASLGSTEKRDRYKTNPKYPDLNKTFLMYWELRQQLRAHVAPSLGYCGAMINEMITKMAVNTANMLARHFRRRLYQYVRL